MREEERKIKFSLPPGVSVEFANNFRVQHDAEAFVVDFMFADLDRGVMVRRIAMTTKNYANMLDTLNEAYGKFGKLKGMLQ